MKSESLDAQFFYSLGQTFFGHFKKGSSDSILSRSKVGVKVDVKCLGQMLNAKLRVGHILTIQRDPRHLSLRAKLIAVLVLFERNRNHINLSTTEEKRENS